MVSYNIRIPFVVPGRPDMPWAVHGTVRWTESGADLYLTMSVKVYDRVRERLEAGCSAIIADYNLPGGGQAPDIVVLKNDRPIMVVPCRRVY